MIFCVVLNSHYAFLRRTNKLQLSAKITCIFCFSHSSVYSVSLVLLIYVHFLPVVVRLAVDLSDEFCVSPFGAATKSRSLTARLQGLHQQLTKQQLVSAISMMFCPEHVCI